MEDCVFCKVIDKQLPSDTVYEDKALIIFKDIRPSAPVHMLIVPRGHIASIADLAEENRGIVAEMIYAAKKYAEKTGLTGYKLIFNVGRDGGQIIDHLHLHLLGGWNPLNDKKDIDAMPHSPHSLLDK